MKTRVATKESSWQISYEIFFILFLFSNYAEMCQRVKISYECKWIKYVTSVDKGKDHGNS